MTTYDLDLIIYKKAAKLSPTIIHHGIVQKENHNQDD